jgi:hypothetical protein
MIIYNVTIKIDWSIADVWVDWMQDIHIPEVIGTGCFVKHQFVKLLGTDEQEGPTYATQYYAETEAKLDDYIHNYAPALRQQTIDKWGDKFIAFRTLMEVVN